MRHWLIILLLCVPVCNAATIVGDVYDFSLSPVNNAIVSIDTAPRQQVVAANGSYSLNVPVGDYVLSAELQKAGVVVASVEENITVSGEGVFNLDLVLFPTIAQPLDSELEIGEAFEEAMIDTEREWWPYLASGIAILAGIALIAFLVRRIWLKKPEKQEVVLPRQAEDIELALRIISEAGGRMSQKDLRKQLPYSEAKVSLLLAQLEHEQRITKIKRGRSNIILLK